MRNAFKNDTRAEEVLDQLSVCELESLDALDGMSVSDLDELVAQSNVLPARRGILKKALMPFLTPGICSKSS